MVRVAMPIRGANFEKLGAVFSGEIRHGEQLALLPEQAVGHRRNVAHVNARAHHPAALAHGLESERHQTRLPEQR